MFGTKIDLQWQENEFGSSYLETKHIVLSAIDLRRAKLETRSGSLKRALRRSERTQIWEVCKNRLFPQKVIRPFEQFSPTEEATVATICCI